VVVVVGTLVLKVKLLKVGIVKSKSKQREERRRRRKEITTLIA
jgi:hypothetical protein